MYSANWEFTRKLICFKDKSIDTINVSCYTQRKDFIMKHKGVLAFAISGIMAISMSVSAYALTFTNKNVKTYSTQRDVGYMNHNAIPGKTQTTTSASGHAHGYDDSYKVASYEEYKDSNGSLVQIYQSGYTGGTSTTINSNGSRTVSSECVKRHHFSCLHCGSNPDSSIEYSTTSNIFKNDGNY